MSHFFKIDIPVVKMTTERLQKYLVAYQSINNCGKVMYSKKVCELSKGVQTDDLDGSLSYLNSVYRLCYGILQIGC